MSRELKRQRDYVAKMRDVERPCPHCHHVVNVLKAVPLDSPEDKGKCPKCGEPVQYQIGLFGGSQWLDIA